MDARNFSRRLLVISVVALTSWLPQPAHAGGLIILKGSNPSPEFARVLSFGKCERFSVNYKVQVPGLGQQIITANEVFDLVEYDPAWLKNDFITDQDCAILQEVSNKVAVLSQRFPAVKKEAVNFLKPITEILEFHSQGLVQFRGRWMKSGEFQTLIDQEKAALAESARKRDAEFRDQTQRQKNLKSRASTLAGRDLLKNYPDFIALLERTSQQRMDRGKILVHHPAAPDQASLLLPKYKKLEITLREGKSLDEAATLFATSETGCEAVRLAVGIRMEGDAIAADTHLSAWQATLHEIAPEVSEWLPIGFVSARTKLQFQRKSSNANGVAKVVRELGGRFCELALTEPTTQDDGTLHALLAVTIY